MAGFQGLFGTVTARNQRIVNFDSFILSHVPYGRVDPEKNLQMGLVEYDGPKANLGLVTKPLLAWNFGGIAYPITKAARVEYTFDYGDSTGLPVKASILLGFQSDLASQSLAPSPQVRALQNDSVMLAAISRVSNAQLPSDFGLAAATQTNNVVTGSALGFKTLDELIDGELLTEIADAAAVRARAAESALDESYKQAAETEANYAAEQAKQAAESHPAFTSYESDPAARELMDTAARLAEEAVVARNAAAKASQFAADSKAAVEPAETAADLVLKAWAERKKYPVIVAFDGPAQDNNSLNPFNYTPQTLFNDKEKYNQVLWWYFGGRPYRVTKAIRLPVRTALTKALTGEAVESLFIGFAGPPGDSTA